MDSFTLQVAAALVSAIMMLVRLDVEAFHRQVQTPPVAERVALSD